MAHPPSIAELRAEASGCRRCRLWERATQTVFGEDPPDAMVMLIGEQPGDEEDRKRHPFVGPAGRVLDRALHLAGIDRTRAYVTNAVKHFKWQPRGKRRLHSKPNAGEALACRIWLEGEIAATRPKVVACLGATAAQSLLGKEFRVSLARGKIVSCSLAPRVVATVHPSSILRAEDAAARHQAMAAFVADLELVASLL
jgi:DNA polymerase